MRRGELVSRRVRYLEYEHVDDDGDTVREHDFGPGVEMWALEDGSVLLRCADGRALWDDFPDPAEDE